MLRAATLILIIIFLSYLWNYTYQILLACWIPNKASPPYLNKVNNYDGLLFKSFKWLSLIVIVGLSFNILAAIIVLVIMIIGGFAR